MKKQEMSLKQQYQRLTMAKAQATRNGQPTPKLDKKIEKMKAMMGSTVQKVPAAKPSAGKFVDYKGVNKLPMQGGACTPMLAPGAHSQFGSGKNTQFEPEQRANPFENVFSKTAVFPPPAIAETDL